MILILADQIPIFQEFSEIIANVHVSLIWLEVLPTADLNVSWMLTVAPTWLAFQENAQIHVLACVDKILSAE